MKGPQVLQAQGLGGTLFHDDERDFRKFSPTFYADVFEGLRLNERHCASTSRTTTGGGSRSAG